MNKTVYGYIRVSTETQEKKGYGLETQRAAIEKYCKDNGLELLDVFEDKGISGTEAGADSEPLSKRKGLMSLLGSLNGTNTIVVLNTSRLWRNDTAKVFIRRELEKKGGDVISIEQPQYSIYNNDPNDKFVNTIFEALDEWERTSISLKLAKGRTTKARKGDKPTGLTPYGYKYTADKKGIEKDETEAGTVKRIYSMAQSGYTIQKIVDTLNGEGIMTRRGKLWTKAAIHKILRNRFYIGILTHQKAEIQGNHEPLISRVQFGKVSAQLKRRHK